MGRLAARAAPSLPWVLLFIVAFGGAFVLVLPVRVGQVGYDTAASVLYFDRLLAGRHLESFVAATPKPLLTVVDGFLHAATGDWRPISWLALAVYALDVVLAGVLARRLAGPVAAAFVAVGVAGTWALLEDASAAYAVGPAVLFWLLAGLLTTAPRPRYGLAGVALLLAGLARFETLILVGLIASVLVGWRLAAALGRKERPPSRAWLLLLGFLALPIQMLHDVLLTGDPFWSERVPVLVSEAGSPLIGVGGAIRLILNHYAPWAILVVLAALGVALLVITASMADRHRACGDRSRNAGIHRRAGRAPRVHLGPLPLSGRPGRCVRGRDRDRRHPDPGSSLDRASWSKRLAPRRSRSRQAHWRR